MGLDPQKLRAKARAHVILGLGRVMPSSPLTKFNKGIRKTPEVQKQILQEILAQHQSTAFGRDHNIQQCLNVKNIQEAFSEIPHFGYPDIESYVARCLEGEPNVLWPGRLTYFAKSSGTTSAAKFLPISEEGIKHQFTFLGTSILSYLYKKRDYSMLDGELFTLSGTVSSLPNQLLVGEVSGVLAHYRQNRMKQRRRIMGSPPIPDEVRALTNFEERLERMIALTIHRDIRCLGLTPSWGLVFLGHMLEYAQANLGRSISTIKEIWPNLKLVSTGGSPLSTYRAALRKLLGSDDVDMIESYGASEGMIAFQDADGQLDMQLHPNAGIYFEFSPFTNQGEMLSQKIPLHKVEVGRSYVPIITTTNGLVSYPLTDVVAFTSTDPYRLVVKGRTADMISRFGEYVLGCELQKSLELTNQAHRVQVRDYHVCPKPAENGADHAHQWFVEFESPPVDVLAFARDLDEKLQGINDSYRKCRAEGGFGCPIITPLPKGTFQRWFSKYQPVVHVQSKVPRAREDRKIADQLLMIVGG